MLSLTHLIHLWTKTLDGAFALSGARKTISESRRWEVDALITGNLLEIVPMAMREVAVVAAVSTDISRIILSTFPNVD